jgi:hypothetical protein
MSETEVQFYRRKAVGHLNSAYYNIGLLLDSKDLTRDEHTIAVSCRAFIKKTTAYLESTPALNLKGLKIG